MNSPLAMETKKEYLTPLTTLNLSAAYEKPPRTI